MVVNRRLPRIGRMSVSRGVRGQGIQSIQHALRTNRLTISSLLDQTFTSIAAQNKQLNAFTALEDKQTLLSHFSPSNEGILNGIPIGIKSNFCTTSLLTTASSKMLSQFQSPYDASVVSKLKSSGALLIGKCNMDEFGMGSFTTTSAEGITLNPLDSQKTAGGSSGGSAAAVASGMCIAAIGSDTGGSVRLPASFCGIVGLKPSYGRVSRNGLISYASSLDCPGVLASSVEDAAAVLSVMEGKDVKDPTSVDLEDPITLEILRNIDSTFLKGKKIGFVSEFHVEELPEHIAEKWEGALHFCESQGAEIIKLSAPSIKHALPTYYIIAAAEASSNLSRYTGIFFGSSLSQKESTYHSFIASNRTMGFGAEVQRRILTGTFVLSDEACNAFFIKAKRIRAQIDHEMRKVLDQVDFIITPTSTCSAPRFDEIKSMDPVSVYMQDIMTVPASLCGLPAVSIPYGKCPEGMPLGLQLIGGSQRDFELLSYAKALEISQQDI